MQPMTHSDLLAAFDLIDRAHVTPPADLAAVRWEDLDYFAWRDAANAHKVYLCVPLAPRAVGLVMRVSTATSGGVGGLCDLCLASDRVHGVTLATTESWSQPRTRYGLHICADFDCSGSVRGLKSVDRMGETLPVGQRVERLQRQLLAFVRRVTATQPPP